MLSRQLRRAAERQAAKEALHAAKTSSAAPVTQPAVIEPTVEPSTVKLTHLPQRCPPNVVSFVPGYRVPDWEFQSDYDELLSNLNAEHLPATATEHILVDQMAQHHWFRERAVKLQERLFTFNGIADEKMFALYLRVETTHERGFASCIKTLHQLRAERRKSEIGFEPQKREEAAEIRKQEIHEARVRLTEARAQHLELDSEINQTIQAPFPGYMRVPFDVLKSTFGRAVAEVSRELSKKEAA